MTPKPWIILGPNGQLGRALQSELKRQGWPFQVWDRSQADLSDPEKLRAKLENQGKSISGILNAAAYTAVDLAEKEKDLAAKINFHSVKVLAEECFKFEIPLIHFSTDYVFDGSGNSPWKEDAVCSPKNVYGLTKLQGEVAIQTEAELSLKSGKSPRWLVFRTSWVYDETGENFPRKILKRAENHESLQVVDDQKGAPTHASDLASIAFRSLEQALNRSTFPSGIYNACSSGITSWWGFASFIIYGAKKRGWSLSARVIHPVPSSTFPTPALRPKNSRLSLEKLQREFKITPDDWRISVERFLDSVTSAHKDLKP